MQVLNSLWETYSFVEFRVVGVEIEVVWFSVSFFDGQREFGLDGAEESCEVSELLLDCFPSHFCSLRGSWLRGLFRGRRQGRSRWLGRSCCLSGGRCLRGGGDGGGRSCGHWCWCWSNWLLLLLLTRCKSLDWNSDLRCCNNWGLSNSRGGNCRTNLSQGRRRCLGFHWCGISLFFLAASNDRRHFGLWYLARLWRSLILLDHGCNCLNFG